MYSGHMCPITTVGFGVNFSRKVMPELRIERKEQTSGCDNGNYNAIQKGTTYID